MELENIRNDHSYGTESNPKIWVMREFVNPAGESSWHAVTEGRALLPAQR
jgi:hypothetical protein